MWTIGHSTRTWEDFVALLRAHGLARLIDVRRFPGSRRYPWFASATMASALAAEGVGYLWLPSLGGRRKPQPGSPNGAWRTAAFQGYADHLTSAAFAQGFAQVQAAAARTRTVVMCAEALWWQCHRRLIADLWTHRGGAVVHVMGDAATQVHPLHPQARARGPDLIYPPLQEGLFPSQ
ncbi:DUF488 family protein [Xanthomonas maliensis]|uniref:DUF488 domain-containing protein n=1 Tax=Xanthomonas maliensis TaxID=1321368 RepID=UPI0009DC20D6|nr:DUF488 domain-containing protein [Xanthomonas maliensis]